MKKSIFTLVAFLLLSVFLFAQTAQQASTTQVAAKGADSKPDDSKRDVLKNVHVANHGALQHANGNKNANQPAPASPRSVPASVVAQKGNDLKANPK